MSSNASTHIHSYVGQVAAGVTVVILTGFFSYSYGRYAEKSAQVEAFSQRMTIAETEIKKLTTDLASVRAEGRKETDGVIAILDTLSKKLSDVDASVQVLVKDVTDKGVKDQLIMLKLDQVQKDVKSVKIMASVAMIKAERAQQRADDVSIDLTIDRGKKEQQIGPLRSVVLDKPNQAQAAAHKLGDRDSTLPAYSDFGGP